VSPGRAADLYVYVAYLDVEVVSYCLILGGLSTAQCHQRWYLFLHCFAARRRGETGSGTQSFDKRP